MALGKIYVFGPVFRAEKSKTRRHLTEFWMVEPEIAYATLDDVMDLSEGLVCHIVKEVLAHHRGDLADLERDASKLEAVVPPFPRISYDEAGSEAPAIEISLGEQRGGSPTHLSHVIEEPTRIWVDQEPDGLGIALQVLSQDEGETRVLFEREAALPR